MGTSSSSINDNHSNAGRPSYTREGYDLHGSRFDSLYKKFIKRFELQTNAKYNGQANNNASRLGVYTIYMPERESHIRQFMSKLPFKDVWFFKGITQKDLSRDDYMELSSTLTIGSPIFEKYTKLCVHLSYLFCLQHALDKHYDYILIFEDDIYMTWSVKELTSIINDFFASGYDVCYLGFCWCVRCEDLLAAEESLILLPTNQHILCKHAIIYKAQYVRGILPQLLPMTTKSDNLFNEINNKYGARVCIPKKPGIFQDREAFGSFNENYKTHRLYS